MLKNTQDVFTQRKRDILSKIDKSSKNSWDKKIAKLCEKVNLLKNSYTSSSCSGRIVLIIDQDKKGRELFVSVYHNKVSFEKLKKDLDTALKKNKKIKFKLEPCILHVACKTLEDAQGLLNKAKLSGWKKSGIISFGKNIVLELNSTEKMEFPIIDNQKILADDSFLRIVVEEANKKLEKSWGKIERLGKLV